MLREMVPPPKRAEFRTDICPWIKPHGFRLDIGDVSVPRTGSWALLCNGSDGYRCAPQRGKELDFSKVVKLRRLAELYAPRANAVQKVYEGIRELEISFAVMYTLWDDEGDCPRLPTEAVDRMATKLHYIKNAIEALNPADVPDRPDVLDDNVADPKGKGKQMYIEIPVSSDSEASENDGQRRWDMLDDDALELVLPSTGRYIYVVIYYNREKGPYHLKFWVPDPTCFDFTNYTFHECPLDATFVLYSAAHDRYESATEPVNLASHGKYMIYRPQTLHRMDCQGLTIWESRARDSLEKSAEEHADVGFLQQPASSRPSKRKLTPESEPTTPVKKLNMDRETTQPVASGSSLSMWNTAPLSQPANLTKKPKIAVRLQRIKDHGGPDQPPLSISTSEPDYSSEVEIVSD